MIRNVLIAGGVLVAIVVAFVAFSVFRTPESASSPIQAIPLAATAAPAADATAAPVATAADAAIAAAAPTAAPAAGAGQSASAQIFEIVPAESEARFLIDEVLRGAPITVVGATDQVAGQIAVNPSAPASTQVGTIQINARTITTDNDFRNRAIKNAILQTDSFEFVTFTPTGISGMPAAVTVGQPFSFQMSGDLTVRDTTQPVTFEVTVTPVSEGEIQGTASTRILYRDFGLNIPDSPAVDTVADEVRLELDFVARSLAG